MYAYLCMFITLTHKFNVYKINLEQNLTGLAGLLIIIAKLITYFILRVTCI
jgi:hypothetical protein